MSEKVVEAIRSGIVESIHTGNIAVVNSNGQLIYSYGCPKQICYFRSSGKPFILLSHLTKKINQAFGFTLQELAIMASSHNGSAKHVEILGNIAEKLGVKEGELTCGVREPYGLREKFELYGSGKVPGQFHNNCSGKHLGNIAECKAVGLSWDNVNDISHPVQKDILKVIAEFSSYPEELIHIGVDGCGVPVFGVPLSNMALAYARLFNIRFMDGKYKDEQRILYEAITMYPDMIAGDDRLDTELIRLTKGDHFGKMGADGVFCVSIQSRELGIAIKIQDGSVRAVDPVIVEVFKQIQSLSAENLEKLNRFHYVPVKTWQGQTVGIINPVFLLKSYQR